MRSAVIGSRAAGVALIMACCVVGARSVRAQTLPSQATLRVRVRDSSGTAMVGIDLAVVRGLADVVTSGATDDAGRRSLAVPQSDDDFQLVVRKLKQPQRRSCPADTSLPPINTNVWVNGRRILSIVPDEMAMARRTGMLSGLLPGSITLLSEIKPEHIDQMTYVDGTDNTVGLVGSNEALFIVLKPGIVYEPGKGSRVDPGQLSSKSADAGRAALAPYRYRVLGVFDIDTGEPVEGAEVRDGVSGTWARTTATGTVSLFFLPEGGSPVRISKPGYEDLTIAVEISAEATLPITLTMKKRPPG
jgi:hypothetical protein